MGVRQRLQKYAINHAEDRRVRADAERHYNNGGSSEARTLPQHPDSVTNVLPEARQKVVSPTLARNKGLLRYFLLHAPQAARQ